MSKLFYDHLVSLEEFEEKLNSRGLKSGDKEELGKIVDDLVGQKVVNTVLSHLPVHCHQEFLMMFKEEPGSESILIYIKEKSGKDIEGIIKDDLKNVHRELLEMLDKI